MDDLIARLEKAGWGSRNLDTEIFRVVARHPSLEISWPFVEDSAWDSLVPRYTVNLHDAMGLMLEGWQYKLIGAEGCRPKAVVTLQGEPDIKGRAFTMPLAVCIAALKARAFALAPV